jgi:AraC-like DNA-binding protein
MNSGTLPLFMVNSGTSTFWLHQPGGVVGQFISMIWASAGTAGFGEERIIPDGSGVLLFNFGDTVSSSAGAVKSETVLKRILYTGLFTHAAAMHYPPGTRHEQLGIIFKPGCSSVFTKTHAGAFKNTALADVISVFPEAERLYDALAACSNPANRIAQAATLLNRLLALNYAGSSEALIQLIRNFPNESPVQIAARTGYSQQHINRILNRDAGANIKTLQRIFRINNAVAEIGRQSSEEHSLTEIALQNGYFDQAHFIHEFSTMTGMLPGAFRKISHLAAGRVIYLP